MLLFANCNLLAEVAVQDLQLGAKQDSYLEDRALDITVDFKLNPGWHIYSKEPGKFGLPTELKLTSTSKFSAKEWVYPTPQKFQELTNDFTWGYANQAHFSLELIPQYNFKKNLNLQVAVKWLACNQELCVPGEQLLKLSLPYQE